MLSDFTRFRIQVVVATFLPVPEQPFLPEMSCDLLMPVALDRLAFAASGRARRTDRRPAATHRLDRAYGLSFAL
jgi:hypothetical protein